MESHSRFLASILGTKPTRRLSCRVGTERVSLSFLRKERSTPVDPRDKFRTRSHDTASSFTSLPGLKSKEQISWICRHAAVEDIDEESNPKRKKRGPEDTVSSDDEDDIQSDVTQRRKRRREDERLPPPKRRKGEQKHGRETSKNNNNSSKVSATLTTKSNTKTNSRKRRRESVHGSLITFTPVVPPPTPKASTCPSDIALADDTKSGTSCTLQPENEHGDEDDVCPQRKIARKVVIDQGAYDPGGANCAQTRHTAATFEQNGNEYKIAPDGAAPRADQCGTITDDSAPANARVCDKEHGGKILDECTYPNGCADIRDEHTSSNSTLNNHEKGGDGSCGPYFDPNNDTNKIEHPVTEAPDGADHESSHGPVSGESLSKHTEENNGSKTSSPGLISESCINGTDMEPSSDETVSKSWMETLANADSFNSFVSLALRDLPWSADQQAPVETASSCDQHYQDRQPANFEVTENEESVTQEEKEYSQQLQPMQSLHKQLPDDNSDKADGPAEGQGSEFHQHPHEEPYQEHDEPCQHDEQYHPQAEDNYQQGQEELEHYQPTEHGEAHQHAEHEEINEHGQQAQTYQDENVYQHQSHEEQFHYEYQQEHEVPCQHDEQYRPQGEDNYQHDQEELEHYQPTEHGEAHQHQEQAQTYGNYQQEYQSGVEQYQHGEQYQQSEGQYQQSEGHYQPSEEQYQQSEGQQYQPSEGQYQQSEGHYQQSDGQYQPSEEQYQTPEGQQYQYEPEQYPPEAQLTEKHHNNQQFCHSLQATGPIPTNDEHYRSHEFRPVHEGEPDHRSSHAPNPTILADCDRRHVFRDPQSFTRADDTVTSVLSAITAAECTSSERDSHMERLNLAQAREVIKYLLEERARLKADPGPPEYRNPGNLRA